MTTNKHINIINFNDDDDDDDDDDDLVSVIKLLDTKKAHVVDNIFICMINWCGDSVILPLALIIGECIANDKFTDSWKCVSLILADKNYRSISLLSIFAKIF